MRPRFSLASCVERSSISRWQLSLGPGRRGPDGAPALPEDADRTRRLRHALPHPGRRWAGPPGPGRREVPRGSVSASAGGAEDVVVAEARRAVPERPGRREHLVARVEGLLAPGVHGRAVGRAAHFGPHAHPVGPRADRVDVVPRNSLYRMRPCDDPLASQKGPSNSVVNAPGAPFAPIVAERSTPCSGRGLAVVAWNGAP